MDNYNILEHKIKIFDEKEEFIITKNKKALKGFVRSYNVKIISKKDPKIQFNSVKNETIYLLENMNRYKYK